MKQELLGHLTDVLCLYKNPSDANLLVSGSSDRSARVWDIRQNKAVQTYSNNSEVNAVCWFSNGTTFLAASDDASCRLYDTRSFSQIHHLRDDGIKYGPTSADVSKSGRFVVTGHDDCQAVIWDVLSEKSLTTNLVSHRDKVSCVGFDCDGHAICTGSWDALLKIWS